MTGTIQMDNMKVPAPYFLAGVAHRNITESIQFPNLCVGALSRNGDLTAGAISVMYRSGGQKCHQYRVSLEARHSISRSAKIRQMPLRRVRACPLMASTRDRLVPLRQAKRRRIIPLRRHRRRRAKILNRRKLSVVQLVRNHSNPLRLATATAPLARSIHSAHL